MAGGGVPIDRNSMLLVDESLIEEKNDEFILASDEMKDHLEIVNHALGLIISVPNLIPHTTDDELIAQRLMVRCLNAAASSLRMARCGYYQPAFSGIRDIVETTFLLDLFNRDAAEITLWHTIPPKEREQRFAPWRVRKRLDDADGNKMGLRGAAYRMLSTFASHPTPEGFSLISPAGMTQIGPFADAGRILAFLQELARNVSYAALVIGSHTPKHNEIAFGLRIGFLAPFNAWRSKYMPGGPDIELDEFLGSLKSEGT